MRVKSFIFMARTVRFTFAVLLARFPVLLSKAVAA